MLSNKDLDLRCSCLPQLSTSPLLLGAVGPVGGWHRARGAVPPLLAGKPMENTFPSALASALLQGHLFLQCFSFKGFAISTELC